MKPIALVLTVFFATLLTNNNLFAQDLKAIDEKGKMHFSIGFDAQFVDFSSLDLTDLNFIVQDLEETIYSFTLETTGELNRWFYNSSFFGGQSQDSDAEIGGLSRYRQFGLNLGIGYNLMNDAKNAWIIGPEIATAPMFAQTVIANRASISQFIQVPTTIQYKFTRFTAPIDLGVRLGYRIFRERNPEEFFFVGLRAGYRLSDGENWELDSGVPAPGIEINDSGLYLGLRFGKSF